MVSMSTKHSRESGSALIWFIFLVSIVLLVSLTLISAVHYYLATRAMTDFTEEFALAIKAKQMLNEGTSIQTLGSSLLLEVAPEYAFQELSLKSLTLQAGNTVKVVFCSKWESPVTSLINLERICRAALAR